MKIAVTGCNGRVGRRVVKFALKKGHKVVGIDYSPAADAAESQTDDFVFLSVDLKDYQKTLDALSGCDAIVQLAAFPDSGDYKVITHNSNVVISWNILRAAAELGITRIAQASSVNVITMVYSENPHFEYFPIDEDHPCLPDEPYGLSKVICELQADTIIRRYPSMRIASLRLHWSVPYKAYAAEQDPARASKDLWGWVQEDSSAEAFILAVAEDNHGWRGHERFFIAAPDIIFEDAASETLKATYWPDVPIKEGKTISGHTGFFDCGKAARLLGWVHKDYSKLPG